MRGRDEITDEVRLRIRSRRGQGFEPTGQATLSALGNLTAPELRMRERRAGRAQRHRAARTHRQPIWRGGAMRRAIDSAVAAAIEQAFMAELAAALEAEDNSWRRRKKPPVRLHHGLSQGDIAKAHERAVERVQKETAGVPWSPARQRETA